MGEVRKALLEAAKTRFQDINYSIDALPPKPPAFISWFEPKDLVDQTMGEVRKALLEAEQTTSAVAAQTTPVARVVGARTPTIAVPRAAAQSEVKSVRKNTNVKSVRKKRKNEFAPWVIDKGYKRMHHKFLCEKAEQEQKDKAFALRARLQRLCDRLDGDEPVFEIFSVVAQPPVNGNIKPDPCIESKRVVVKHEPGSEILKKPARSQQKAAANWAQFAHQPDNEYAANHAAAAAETAVSGAVMRSFLLDDLDILFGDERIQTISSV